MVLWVRGEGVVKEESMWGVCDIVSDVGREGNYIYILISRIFCYRRIL